MNNDIANEDGVTNPAQKHSKDLEAFTKIVYSMSHLPAAETGRAILDYIGGDLDA